MVVPIHGCCHLLSRSLCCLVAGLTLDLLFVCPREKSGQMEPRASLVPQEERVQLGSRVQKERKGSREKRETQEKMEWAGQAFLALQALQGLWSMCRMRM